MATVKRVAAVCSQEVGCGRNASEWSGPANATVHVTLTSAPDCPASVMWQAPGAAASDPNNSAPAGGTKKVDLVAPGRGILRCMCGGEEGGSGNCTCTITGVDPPLPPGVTLGAVTSVTPGPLIKNPPAGTAVAVGTPVDLDCGNTFVLWSGPPSYVSVDFHGDDGCEATLTADGTAKKDSQQTDKTRFGHTFGPVTQITATCGGKGKGGCQFTVTETVQLP